MGRRRLVAIALGALLALLLACPLAGWAAANPAAQTRWWHSPILLGRHMLSVGVNPCGPSAPGRLVIAYNAFISSRYPPPGIYLPIAPPCP